MNGAVTVAYVHPNEVAHSWHLSLVDLLTYDSEHERRIVHGGRMAARCGTDGLPAARNQIVASFLAENAEWLFWIDTDMGFRPDSVERLLEIADPVDRPIVGALCFAQKEVIPDGLGGFRCQPEPTIFDWVSTPDGDRFLARQTWQPGSVVRCAATGSACILIHRSVLEKIAEKHGPTWYHRIPHGSGEFFGEDVSFCMRAGSLKIPVHVHTGVKTSHLKQTWVQEPDYWEFHQPDPATEPTAVIVPVMGRPQNAEPFMRSLRASTGLATVYAIAGPESTAEATAVTEKAWRDAGAQVLTGIGITFAEKVNQGYRSTEEPWLFIVGDDVRFHPGWLDHAQDAAGDRFHVIGTNDLGNPRVMAGEHATHLLIRRSYVDEQGASWDGPKVVCHEGYRHWFVDDEIVTAAKQRSVWTAALGSVVEHMHPAWNKGENDEVYELGQSHAAEDRKLFARRLKANAS